MVFEQKHFQIEGSRFLASGTRSFLLDDKGLGKTNQAILGIKALPYAARAVILCEQNKIFDWREEFRCWWPECNTFLARGEKVSRKLVYTTFAATPAPSVLITNHHKVIHDYALLYNTPYDGIVIDESEVCNNLSAQLNLNTRFIAANRKFIWQLTATPFGRNLLQFYNLFIMMGLDIFGTPQDFMDRFCVMAEKRFKVNGRLVKRKVIIGAQNIDDFKAVAAQYCLRRSRKSAGIILPPVTVSAVTCEMTDSQKKMFESAKKNTLETISRDEMFNPMSRYHYMTEILDSPWLIDDKEKPDMPKIDAIIYEYLKNPEKVVVFTQFVKWFGLLVPRFEKEGIKVFQYNGTLSDLSKEKSKTAFRDYPGPCVFLCTEAAKRGINLQFCHNLFCVDIPFNPVSLVQLFGRIDRMGQKENVRITYFLMEHTHEEHIFKVLLERADIIDKVMDSNTSAAFNLEQIFSETLRAI